MSQLDVWLNHYNGHPIIIKRYNNGVMVITSRRVHCDFVMIIGNRRNTVAKVLKDENLQSPIVMMDKFYHVAIVGKGAYYDN